MEYSKYIDLCMGIGCIAAIMLFLAIKLKVKVDWKKRTVEKIAERIILDIASFLYVIPGIMFLAATVMFAIGLNFGILSMPVGEPENVQFTTITVKNTKSNWIVYTDNDGDAHKVYIDKFIYENSNMQNDNNLLDNSRTMRLVRLRYEYLFLYEENHYELYIDQ